MDTQALSQLHSFFIFILVGFLIGILFDIFRISRRTFKTSNIVTNIEDVLFWILSGLLFIFSLFKFNNGNIRVYILVGLIIGISIYMLIFSKIVINTLVKIVTIIKRIISYFIKILLCPINFLVKILKNMTNKIKNMQNKQNIKKDFG